MLKEANSALNALKENSALKKQNKELEDNFEMTCSSKADQLNMNAKYKINDKKASALAFHNLEAESNIKLRRLTKRIGQLEAENSVIQAKKYKVETHSSHLRQKKKNDFVRIKN